MTKSRRFFVCAIVDEEDMRLLVAKKFNISPNAPVEVILEIAKHFVTPVIESG